MLLLCKKDFSAFEPEIRCLYVGIIGSFVDVMMLLAMFLKPAVSQNFAFSKAWLW